MLNHYGLDWLAMALTFVAIHLLGDKRRSGFGVMIVGNVSWIAVGFTSASVAMIVANAVFIAMNVRGFVKWTPQAA